MKNLGLYVHIPFCKSKCGYCDFNSYANKDTLVKPYFSALISEISSVAEKYPYPIDTVYFGGGTPTYVDEEYLVAVLKTIRQKFEQCSNCEITAECNPGTIDFEGLKILYNSGFNRLSIGLQSADNSCLMALGRIHTAEDFRECFENARKAGFNNISLDLMYGLPDQTMKQWRNTLEYAAQLGAEHISCYSLKVEEGTPFSKMDLTLPDDDTVADMYESAVEYLKKQGYDRYEISNFSRFGYQSLHNLKYWQCCDYLGVGAGAFSCANGVRFSNILDIEEYVKCINNTKSALSHQEPLSDFDKISEYVFLGLRLKNGISEKDFAIRFKLNIDEIFGAQIEKYTNLGFLIRENGKIRFSDKGFFVSNTILADFV